VAGGVSAPSDRHAEVEALIEEGLQLSRSAQAEQAIGFYERAIALCEPAGDPGLSDQHARALVNKAISLERLGRNAEAVDVCDEILGRFSQDSHDSLRDHLVRSLLVKGYNLAEQQRYEEALKTYDELLERFGAAEDRKTLEMTAWAFELKSHALLKLDRPWDALCAYESFIELGRRLGRAEFAPRIAAALYNRGVVIGRLSPSELSQLADMDPPNRRPTSGSDVGSAEPKTLKRLFRTARSVASTGLLDSRSALQLRAFDDVVLLSHDSHDHTLQWWSAMALVQKGSILCELGRQRRAIAIFDEVIRHYCAWSDPKFDEPISTALVGKSRALVALGRREDAVRVDDEVVNRYGASDSGEMRARVASTMLNKGSSLERLGQMHHASKVFGELVDRFGTDDDPEIRKTVAIAGHMRSAVEEALKQTA
jgi:tetratricopeptide (TPR) repeat protein